MPECKPPESTVGRAGCGSRVTSAVAWPRTVRGARLARVLLQARGFYLAVGGSISRWEVLSRGGRFYFGGGGWGAGAGVAGGRRRAGLGGRRASRSCRALRDPVAPRTSTGTPRARR